MFIVPVLVVILLAGSGCEKIKLNRLKGYWKLKSWKLTTLNDTTIDGMLLFPEKTGDEIILEFPDDGEALVVVFSGDTLRFADNGKWIQENNFETITFTDSVFFFNKDVPYEFVTLSKSKLELTGTFVTGVDSFPTSVIKFESAD